MSVKHNGKTIASNPKFHPDLLEFKWSDHLLNDPQWLRADTFSQQYKSVYGPAYDHLADDIVGKTLQSETVAGITIQFYLADDKHKICPASEESNVAAIYAATGVAWYYIIDTTNQWFKLPRTKFGFTGLRDNVGKYVEAGLPNITGHFFATERSDSGYGDITSGAFTSKQLWYWSFGGGSVGINDKKYILDASRSSSIYGNSNTVQPPATQMYLYFYVGNFTQTALENTAGINTEIVNDFSAHRIIDFQEPTALNNYTWYRLYADGWVEQGGVATITSNGNSITLPIKMTDTNYDVFSIVMTNTGAYNRCYSKNTTTIGMASSGGNNTSSWMVYGMAA